jgi:hypothetical protein
MMGRLRVTKVNCSTSFVLAMRSLKITLCGRSTGAKRT